MVSAKQIENFLKAVELDFPVPLSQKTDLVELSIKLSERADAFTIEDKGKIVSAVFGYIDNASGDLGYISIVATLLEYRGNGYSKKLTRDFLNKAEKKGLKGVHLYTVRTNTAAVQLYCSLGFEEYLQENEPRPDDYHLIKRFGD